MKLENLGAVNRTLKTMETIDIMKMFGTKNNSSRLCNGLFEFFAVRKDSTVETKISSGYFKDYIAPSYLKS